MNAALQILAIVCLGSAFVFFITIVLAAASIPIAKALIRMRTSRELSALTDTELSDIGLTRGDIDRVAHEEASRRCT